MSVLNDNTQPEFFGRDAFVPFLGQVEDVDDPKRGGRVKVRCVGWHPNKKKGDDDALTTDDLPWAQVAMPTTHAQQSRVGGKHGLLPGSWVMGFFLDGEDGNHPFILNTFNFTPKAVDKDKKEKAQGQDGKLSEEDQAFADFMYGAENQNISLRTTDEAGAPGFSTKEDPGGAVTLDESEGKCSGQPDRKSAAYDRRMAELKKGDQGNVESQNYAVTIGDGLCGSVAHARDDIQKKMMEMMPSQLSRFIFNDAVWNTYTGEFMDLNGIMAQLALEISSLLKQPLNSLKSQTEELNRVTKSLALAIPDRDGVITQTADKTTTIQADLVHAIFQEGMIDQLYSMVLAMLQGMNNSGSSASDSNEQYPGTQPNTQINNTEALCLTDTILDNVNKLGADALALATEVAESGDEEDEEDNNNIASQSSSLSVTMIFPLIQKYAKMTGVFNSAGSRSQDKKTKQEGCNMEREYQTVMGSMASLMGFGGGGGSGSGGSSGGGSNNNSSGDYDYSNVGFGGRPGEGSNTITYIPCEDATVELVPDPEYDNPTTGDNGGVNPDVPLDGGNNATAPGASVTTPGQPGQGGTDPTDPATPTTPQPPTINGQTPEESIGTGTGATVVNKPSTQGGFGSITNIDDTPAKKISIPRGQDAIAVAMALPSADRAAAKNYIEGRPNIVVIFDPGKYYYYNNPVSSKRVFPSIYIPGYVGTPVPVIDRKTGEFVAILTKPKRWDEHPRPPVTLIADDASRGIVSDDPDYEISIGGFFIRNTGFAYEDPTITIVDKDNGSTNFADIRPVLKEGRIVGTEILNNGTGFRRIPEVRITDRQGYGAVLMPIMYVRERAEDVRIQSATQKIQCPSELFRNLL